MYDGEVRWLGFLLLAGCRQLLGFEGVSSAPVDDAPPVVADASTDAAVDPVDACIGICEPAIQLFERLGCADTPVTANELCQGLGYSGATSVKGYGWWQCGGTRDRCPGGFVGLDCPDWCTGVDCAGFPFCDAGRDVIELVGDGATTFDARDYPGTNCDGFNPGWTIRATCVP